MVLDELKVPFRWYENASYKISNNAECEGHRYKLITPYDRLLPFMVRFQSDGGTPHLPLTWKIYRSDDDTLAFTLTIQDLEYYNFGIWDYIVYKGGAQGGLDLASGFYYSVITTQDDWVTLTSEDFWVDCEDDGREVLGDFSDDFNDDFGPADASGGLRKYTKIEWWNDCDLGNILYQTGYKNILYVESNLQRGEPTIVEEGSEDGNKDFIITSIKYIDKIKLDEYLPEYVLTALLPIRLHKNVLITTARNGYTGKGKSFQVDFNFVNDCYAVVNCSFNQETTFLRRNCCDNNAITDNYRCSTTIGSLTVIQDNPGEFTLNWQLVDGSSPTFQIISSSISGGAPVEQPGTTYNSSGWAAGTIVSGIVRGKCVNPDNGKVSYGNELEFYVNVDNCADPTGLALTEITDTGAKLSWDNMGAGSFYDIKIELASGGGPLLGYPQQTTQLEHTFSDLDPETDYLVFVRKECGYQESNWVQLPLTTFG